MSGVATKPLSSEQFDLMIADMCNADSNTAPEIIAITLLLMKATRVGDLLTNLKIADVYDNNGNVRDSIRYAEGKTSKIRIIPISRDKILREKLAEIYEKSLKNRDRETSNIFFSRKATGKFKRTPISTVTVNRNLQKYVGKFGIEEISTHAIRKTACRKLYDLGRPIEAISELLNHSDTKTTRIYICLNSVDVNKCYDELVY